MIDDMTNGLAKRLGKYDGMEVNCRFACNYGGLLSSKEESEDEDDYKPPYPMLPVNVMESMISVLMNAKLTSKGS